MKKIIYTLLSFMLISSSLLAQWTDLKAPVGVGPTDSYDYSLIKISKNGKNIAAYTSKTVWNPGYVNTKHFIISKDYGVTFSEVPGPAVNPTQFFWEGDVLFLQESLSKALKKSVDFGATFTVQNDNVFSIGLAEKIHQIAPDNWIYIIGISNRIMQSSDMGVSWTDKGAASASAGANLFSTVVASNGNIVSTGVTGAAYSSDNGLTWNAGKFPTTLPNSGDNTLSMADNGDILLFVFPSKLIFKSTDNGQNFSQITSNLASTAGNCRYLGNDIICIGTDAATYKSTDGGINFTKLTDAGALFTASLFGTKNLEKANNTLFTSGTNKIYRYGTSTSMSEKTNTLTFTMYPNPSNGVLNFSGLSFSGLNQINIYSVSGAKVLSSELKSETISVSELPNGIYFVEVIDNHKNKAIKKLVIKG